MKRIHKITLSALLLLVLAFVVPVGYFYVNLPDQANAANANDLRQIFELGSSKASPSFIPKAEGGYPATLPCAICEKSSCSWKFAAGLAQKAQGDLPQSMAAFHLRALLQAIALRLHYDSNFLERLYIGAYSNSSTYRDLGATCTGLFKKECMALSEDEVVYLSAWLEGREHAVDRLKASPQALSERREQMLAACRR